MEDKKGPSSSPAVGPPADQAGEGGEKKSKKQLAKEARKQARAAGKARAKASGESGKPKPAKGDSTPTELELPDARDGEVVTRFPPEASGYLHIGHAKAAILNDFFAKRYNGRLLVRFDDTNPSKEKVEYEECIIEDLKTLGIEATGPVTWSSDYFVLMLDYCTKMIKEGLAYCDDTPVEKMRQERMDGVTSARRDLSVDKNLEIWEEMQNGTEIGLVNCVRAKIDMSCANKAMRDPVVYRCNLDPHARSGTQYKVYPTYDFCCPIVDSVEGVTHALRTTEYHDRDVQYKWIADALGIRCSQVWDFGRLNMVSTLMSKRRLRYFVEQKIVDGWDDPRFPTVQGMMRRGLKIEALREFIIGQGPSRNVVMQEWDKIWTINKKVIDPISPRYSAVGFDDRVPVIMRGQEETKGTMFSFHSKNESLGKKEVFVGPRLFMESADAAAVETGEEVTMMKWGNAIVAEVRKNEEGDVSEVVMDLHLEGDFKLTKKKLNWVIGTKEMVEDRLYDLSSFEFDHLITKEKLEEGDELEDYITKESKHLTRLLGEPAFSFAKKGDILQVERRGFYRVDDVDHNTRKATLFFIPSGKANAMSTLGTKVQAQHKRK